MLPALRSGERLIDEERAFLTRLMRPEPSDRPHRVDAQLVADTWPGLTVRAKAAHAIVRDDGVIGVQPGRGELGAERADVIGIRAASRFENCIHSCLSLSTLTR